MYVTGALSLMAEVSLIFFANVLARARGNVRDLWVDGVSRPKASFRKFRVDNPFASIIGQWMGDRGRTESSSPEGMKSASPEGTKSSVDEKHFNCNNFH